MAYEQSCIATVCWMHLWSFVELVKYSHLFLSYVLSLPPGLLNGLSRSPPACLMDWLRIDGVFYDYHSAHSEPFIGASWMALMHFTSLSFTPLWLSSFSFWISFFFVSFYFVSFCFTQFSLLFLYTWPQVYNQLYVGFDCVYVYIYEFATVDIESPGVWLCYINHFLVHLSQIELLHTPRVMGQNDTHHRLFLKNVRD